MLKVNHTLVLTVSALALSAENVSAAFPNPPLASVLCTKLHTSYNSQSIQSSALNQSPLNVMLVLNNSAGIPRHEAKTSARDDNSFFAAGTMPSNAFMPLSIHNQLTPAGAPRLLASVCFITDTGACAGNTFGGGGSEEYPSGGQPDWNNDQDKKCALEGFHLTSCNSVQEPSNRCPYNENIFEKCICKPGLVSCSAGQTGVGESCGGKYSSCKCRTDLISCNSLQNGQDASCGGKYESCICKPSLVTCTAPNIGVGETCGGKYASCCNNTCQSGYDLNNGSCRQASSIVTGCGNKCYKILSNSCKSGQLSAPAESGGYKNKIVSYTECGNPCFQSYNDNCPSGYVKTKESGKCYEATAKYTDYGTACYKEKACCTNSCTLSSCPTNGNCSFEACSGKYCLNSCQSGYDKSGNTCIRNCNDYNFDCTRDPQPYPEGTGIVGGSGASCNGKYKTCQCYQSSYTFSPDGNVCCPQGTSWNFRYRMCRADCKSNGMYDSAQSGMICSQTTISPSTGGILSCYKCSPSPCGSGTGVYDGYYCCNGKPVGVQSGGIIVAITGSGITSHSEGASACSNYSSCGGRLPTLSELSSIYSNLSEINSKLSAYGSKIDSKGDGSSAYTHSFWSSDYCGYGASRYCLATFPPDNYSSYYTGGDLGNDRGVTRCVF